MTTHRANSLHNIKSLIITIRKQKVILDSDVASIYGVETRDINKTVKNNVDKFPKGYIFKLKQNKKLEVVENFHHLKKIKFSSNLPKAFTEKGLYMLATILKSTQATKATLQIIETFAKVRQFSKVAKILATETDKNKQQKLITRSGELIGDIFNQES